MKFLRWLRDISDALFIGNAITFDDALRRTQYVNKQRGRLMIDPKKQLAIAEYDGSFLLGDEPLDECEVCDQFNQLAEEVEKKRIQLSVHEEINAENGNENIRLMKEIDRQRKALEWYKAATAFAFERDNGEIACAALKEYNEQL